MAFPGELKGVEGTICIDHGVKLKLEVCQSMAGYYLGYICPKCGPYSRETDYYRTKQEDEAELASGQITKLRR